MTTPPIIDCHTHTFFSDGEASFDENFAAAVAAGCTVVVAADHLTLPLSMDPLEEVQVKAAELPAHRASFEAAWERIGEAAGTRAPECIYGFECDWYPGCEPNVTRWSAGASVHLGSVHWIGDPGGATEVSGWIDDPDDLHVWENLGPDEVWRQYVEAWCCACESPIAFDVMAHPDLPMRFSRDGLAASIDLMPLFRRMAECARDCGRRIEINTAASRKGCGDFYPSQKLLDCFYRSGVPITVGSDAHRACDIAYGIRDAYSFAQSVGYRNLDVPHRDGSWSSLRL